MNRIGKALSTVTTVIITGGSSGIGEAFIRLILRINTSVRICNLSRTIPVEFVAQPGFHHIPVDLTDPVGLAAAAAQAENFAMTPDDGRILLINNSGYGVYGVMDQADRAAQLTMLDLNVRAVVDLTHRLLPLLRARGGAILNIASTAGWQPTPYLATYGASKAFLLQWSLAIEAELRGSGVGVLTVCPGPTESNFFRRAGFDQPPLAGHGHSSAQVAAMALDAWARGRRLVVCGWRNRIMVALACRLPRAWQGRLAGAVLRRVRPVEDGADAPS